MICFIWAKVSAWFVRQVIIYVQQFLLHLVQLEWIQKKNFANLYWKLVFIKKIFLWSSWFHKLQLYQKLYLRILTSPQDHYKFCLISTNLSEIRKATYFFFRRFQSLKSINVIIIKAHNIFGLFLLRRKGIRQIKWKRYICRRFQC